MLTPIQSLWYSKSIRLKDLMNGLEVSRVARRFCKAKDRVQLPTGPRWVRFVLPEDGNAIAPPKDRNGDDQDSIGQIT